MKILGIIICLIPAALVVNTTPPDQTYIEGLISKGNVAYLNGDYTQALELYYKAYKADVDNQNAASNYALTLSRIGRNLEGRWFLFEYIQKHPTAAWAWNTRAVITEESGDYEKCLLYAEKALLYDPSLTAARYNRACYLARLGRRPEALMALKDALSEEPGFALSAYYDNDLESLTSMTIFWEMIKEQLDQ